MNVTLKPLVIRMQKSVIYVLHLDIQPYIHPYDAEVIKYRRKVREKYYHEIRMLKEGKRDCLDIR